MPPRARASTAYPPTPPMPNTATRLRRSFSMPSAPKSIRVLEKGSGRSIAPAMRAQPLPKIFSSNARAARGREK